MSTYGVIDSKVCDFNYLRYVGWDEQNACMRGYFSPETVRMISKKVTELTRGVDKRNRPIIVANERICEVMDGVYQGFVPPTGDIYSRYIIPTDEQQNMVQILIDRAIEIIVNNVRNQLEIEQNNEKLSAWVQVYGDFNTHGLRYHPIIKVQEKRPETMQFNMNY